MSCRAHAGLQAHPSPPREGIGRYRTDRALPKPNTVQLSRRMAFSSSTSGILGSDFLLIGKELIFRLTPCLLRRHRRAGRRSSRISSRAASCGAALRRGGNGKKAGKLSLDDANRVNEGKPVGIDVSFERRFMHQSANGEVRHHQPIKLLAHELRRLAAQDDLGAAQARLPGFGPPPTPPKSMMRDWSSAPGRSSPA
jgi:hypothetical protein